MKLLILTQKVDINDDLLGFFHGWLEKLAEKVEKISVVALYVGQYNLPANVKVFSLGKTMDRKGCRVFERLKYLWNFYKYIWKLRKDYDGVFVHMNVEYVLLAGWLWRLLGKKIVLWYAHYLVDWRLKLAVFFSHQVVVSTAFACEIKSSKLKIIGQGIDVGKFKFQTSNLKNNDEFHILYLGRISRIKNIDILIRAFTRLTKNYTNLFLDIVGMPTSVDEDYSKEIHDLIKQQNIAERVKWWGGVPNYKAVEFYNRADLYVNLTRTGSFDKTSLEAMACETPSLICNKAFYEYFDENLQRKMIFEEGSEENLTQKIENFLRLSGEEREQIGKKQREVVEKYHSLDNLTNNIINVFQGLY